MGYRRIGIGLFGVLSGAVAERIAPNGSLFMAAGVFLSLVIFLILALADSKGE